MRRINCLLGITFHGWAALSGFTKILLCILVVIAGAIVSSEVFSKGFSLDLLSVWLELEKDKAAPVDYGFGPGAGIGPASPNRVLGETPPMESGRSSLLQRLETVGDSAEAIDDLGREAGILGPSQKKRSNECANLISGSVAAIYPTVWRTNRRWFILGKPQVLLDTGEYLLRL